VINSTADQATPRPLPLYLETRGYRPWNNGQQSAKFHASKTVSTNQIKEIPQYHNSCSQVILKSQYWATTQGFWDHLKGHQPTLVRGKSCSMQMASWGWRCIWFVAKCPKAKQ